MSPPEPPPCAAGRTLIYEEPDWQAPCPAPPTDILDITDLNVEIVVCAQHLRALIAIDASMDPVS